MRVCERCSREQRVVLEPVRTNTLCHRSAGLREMLFSLVLAHAQLAAPACTFTFAPTRSQGETACRLLCGFY